MHAIGPWLAGVNIDDWDAQRNNTYVRVYMYVYTYIIIIIIVL